MPTYRAYVLHPNGKIAWGEWIDAASQQDAEAEAQRLCDGGHPTVELWQGTKRLAELGCENLEVIRAEGTNGQDNA